MRISRNMPSSSPVPPATASSPSCDDVRCGCGNLLARVTNGEIELKCRRCKQVWRLALGDTGERRGGWRLLEGRAP